jgi:hypothetical protein
MDAGVEAPARTEGVTGTDEMDTHEVGPLLAGTGARPLCEAAGSGPMEPARRIGRAGPVSRQSGHFWSDM